jgi:hypothetical protein
MTEDIYIRLTPELTTAVATTPDGAEELPLETPSAVTTLSALLLGMGRKEADPWKEHLRESALVSGINLLRAGLALLVHEPDKFADPNVFADHVITLARVADQLGEMRPAKA